MNLFEVSGMKKLFSKDEKLELEKWQKEALENFEAKINDKHRPFPCIPATQGYFLNHFRYGFVGDPRNAKTITELASVLKEYSINSREFGRYSSLIVFFKNPQDLIETYNVDKFEQLFWKQLNGLSSLDPLDWPNHIPDDPHNPAWEFCFHGEPYFMYCATPSHKNRKSRHFNVFMLAITPRWVLENFNASSSKINKIKSEIRNRLANYDSIPAHPSLNTYGQNDNYEWKQYFLHDEDTTLNRCPFHKK